MLKDDFLRRPWNASVGGGVTVEQLRDAFGDEYDDLGQPVSVSGERSSSSQSSRFQYAEQLYKDVKEKYPCVP